MGESTERYYERRKQTLPVAFKEWRMGERREQEQPHSSNLRRLASQVRRRERGEVSETFGRRIGGGPIG